MSSLRFEWNRDKAAANRRRHGVTFDEAATVFLDALSATIPDPDHSVGEQRFVTMGLSSRGRLLVVAHRDLPASIRIISARRATTAERERYED